MFRYYVNNNLTIIDYHSLGVISGRGDGYSQNSDVAGYGSAYTALHSGDGDLEPAAQAGDDGHSRRRHSFACRCVPDVVAAFALKQACRRGDEI